MPLSEEILICDPRHVEVKRSCDCPFYLYMEHGAIPAGHLRELCLYPGMERDTICEGGARMDGYCPLKRKPVLIRAMPEVQKAK